MKFKRKLERSKMPKVMKHCGMPMAYKEAYKEYVCERCGKIKKAQAERASDE